MWTALLFTALSACENNVCENKTDFANFLAGCRDDDKKTECCTTGIQALDVSAVDNFQALTVGLTQSLFVEQLEIGTCLSANTPLNLTEWSKIQFQGNAPEKMFLLYLDEFIGLSDWDVSQATRFDSMFESSSFNGDISAWNVKNAVSLASMFAHSDFNRDINNWDVSQVEDMSNLFLNNSAFDQSLACWDVSNVTSAANMFYQATSFESNLRDWQLPDSATTTKMFLQSAMEDNSACQPHATDGTCALDACLHSATTLSTNPSGPSNVTTTPEISEKQEKSSEEKGLGAGEIAGIAVGSVLGAGLIIYGVAYGFGLFALSQAAPELLL